MAVAVSTLIIIVLTAWIIIVLFAWIILLKREFRKNISVTTEAGNEQHRIESNCQFRSNPSPELDDSQINELHQTYSNPSPELDDSQITELHHTNLCELHSAFTPAELTAAAPREFG